MPSDTARNSSARHIESSPSGFSNLNGERVNRTATRHGGFPEARTEADIARNLAAMKTNIAAACRRAGRDPSALRLLPVSKTVEERRIRLAYAHGRALDWYAPNTGWSNEGVHVWRTPLHD